MSRFGTFVDAGYLFAESGKLLFGVKERRRLRLSFDSFHEQLTRLATESCRCEHLRTYWYDGARDAVPTPYQAEIASKPGVKLRLGRLTAHGQKGVDSRIVRDLITLSYERAISTAYLLGGDEDLREGVSEAQERGVRVVLCGIEPLDERNLSPTLVMEADDLIVLDRSFLEGHFGLRELMATAAAEPENPHDPVALGRAFAVMWSETVPSDNRKSLVASRNEGIPATVDKELLAYARRSLGVAQIDDEARRALRAGFWQEISLLSDALGT